MKKQLFRTLTASILLMSTSVLAEQAPSRTECIAPAKPGGGFDLTCKLIQVSLMETGAIEKPMRVTYMPGGVGAVAYNAIVAQRPAEAGTVVAFSGGSLLNLSQGKFGRYGVDDVRWLASVGTDYGMIAVRQDAPWKTLKDLLTAMEKDPNSVVIGAGASIGSQDWMKSALLAQKANVDPHKMRYVAFEGGGDGKTEPLKTPGVHQQNNHHRQQLLQHVATGPTDGVRMAQQQRHGADQHQTDNAKREGTRANRLIAVFAADLPGYEQPGYAEQQPDTCENTIAHHLCLCVYFARPKAFACSR